MNLDRRRTNLFKSQSTYSAKQIRNCQTYNQNAALLIKELFQLMKDQRREQYTLKARKEKKQKQSRQQKITIGENLTDKINKLDPQGIIDFMTEEYQQIINKSEEIGNSLNNAIIIRLSNIKNNWRQFHKERLLTYLQKQGLNYKPIANLTFTQSMTAFLNNNQNKQKYGLYPSYGNGDNYQTLLQRLNQPRYTNYYLKESDEKIDFKIQYKRMVKDTVEMCKAIINLVGSVHFYLKAGDYTYL